MPKILWLGGLIVLVLVIWSNFRGFIYPPLHRNQPSPASFFNLLPNAAKTMTLPEIIEHGPRDVPKIALTFDADMTISMYQLLKSGLIKSWYNEPVINTLIREKAKATIFFGGLWVKAYPDQARQIAQNPFFEIGNHSYSHPAFSPSCYNLPFISDNGDFDEVEDAQKIIRETTGITPNLFRFPGGCYDKIDLNTISQLKLKVVHWDIPSSDGFNPDPASIISQVESSVQNGSIIVFHLHDGPYAPKTNDALVRVIPDLRARGFQFVTVSELLSP